MRILAKSIVGAAGLASAIILMGGHSVAKDEPLLLNCRLIDQASDLWRRYCHGEKPVKRIVCQGTYCYIVITNYDPASAVHPASAF